MIVVEDIQFLAGVYGWDFTLHNAYFKELWFEKRVEGGINKLTIYYIGKKLTVVSNMCHPKLGRNELVRKNVDLKLLEKIFDNPRIHTNKGYIKNARNRH